MFEYWHYLLNKENDTNCLDAWYIFFAAIFSFGENRGNTEDITQGGGGGGWQLLQNCISLCSYFQEWQLQRYKSFHFFLQKTFKSKELLKIQLKLKTFKVNTRRERVSLSDLNFLFEKRANYRCTSWNKSRTDFTETKTTPPPPSPIPLPCVLAIFAAHCSRFP